MLPFGVVATGPESRKLTIKGAKGSVRSTVERLQKAGGRFYLCEADLRRAGLSQKDVLPGVRIERSVARNERTPPPPGDEVAQVRRACS